MQNLVVEGLIERFAEKDVVTNRSELRKKHKNIMVSKKVVLHAHFRPERLCIHTAVQGFCGT